MKKVNTGNPNLTMYIIEATPFDRLCTVVGKAVIFKFALGVTLSAASKAIEKAKADEEA